MDATFERAEQLSARPVNSRDQAVGSNLVYSVAVVGDNDRPRLVGVAIHLLDRGYMDYRFEP
jgi:hypothetical protein